MSNRKRSQPSGAEGTEKKRSCSEQQQKESAGPKTEDSTDNQTTDNMSDVIELNVGGIVQTTYRTTLTKDPDSKLAAMFSGREVTMDKNGRFFLDCNGKVFQYILDFLRIGTLPPPEKALKVYDLAENYKIESLLKELESFHAVQYRKNIKKIRCEIRKDRVKAGYYKNLKNNAIFEIEKRNISPMTDKVLHFETNCQLTDNRVRYHTEEDLRRFKAREAEISANIRIKADCPMSDDLKQLLAYELCELGFGKYFHISTCYGDELINCHAIVLLTH